MVKSYCRSQGSIPNRWDGIKVKVSVSILRHRAQAFFSEHGAGKGMKLLYRVVGKSCIKKISRVGLGVRSNVR